MTNKEIIIDGVDVSECEYSFKQFDNWIGKDVVMCDCTLGCRCEPKENHCKFYMYYLEQQLKRKEKVRKEWKEEYRVKVEELNELEEKLLRKEQECEKLKKQVEIFTRQLEKANREVIKEKEKNATQRQENATQLHENDKLKQTLTEIKGIAEGMNTECFYNDFDCKDCDMKNGCTYQGRLKILQKISEVVE